MSPSELESVYNDLSQVPQQTAEQAIGQLGQQQAAQGPSAAAMGASGGYGIGNYTYNRLVDPTVQQLSTQLVSTGRSQALNRAISLALSQAQENYRNAYNSYANRPSGNGGGGGGGGDGGNGTITGVDETVSTTGDPASAFTEKQKLDMINSLAYDDKLKMIELATKYGWDANKISELNKKYYGSKNSYYDAGNNKAGISANYGGTYVPAAGGYSLGGGSSNGGSSNTIPFNVFTASIGGI